MSRPFDTQIVTVGDVRSPVPIGGPASDEAVVFLHGNNSGADWTPLTTPVAEFAQVIAPDMPGFGDADKPADWPYTVAAYADHLNAILEQLGIRRAHLVAHDFGGPWALAWAADHLDAVASITLINTPKAINHFAAKVWRTPFAGELMWRLTNARRMARLLRSSDPGLPGEAADAIASHAMVPGTQRAVLRLYRSTGEDAIGQYTERLARFAGDVLIIWGDRDAYIAADQAEQQRALFRKAEITAVPGAGHWPWLEQPDLVARYLTDFLRRQTAKTAASE